MCDLTTIAGLALTAGSTLANASAQSKIENAREDALAAERIRQLSLDKEADALNVQSQDRFKNFEGQQDEKAEKLGDYFTGQEIAPPAASDALPTSASNITVREEANQRGQAKAFTDKTGKALGDLRSFGDLLGDISRLQGRDATSIGQIGGFKRGSSNVVPYELEAANSKGAGLQMLGDIMGGVGGIATNAGLSGGSFFGGSGGAVKSSTPKVSGLSLYPKSNAHTVRL